MFDHEVEVISGLSNREYHSSPYSISKSGLDLIDKDPFLYWDGYLNPDHTPERRREAFIIGEAVHTLVLEPDKEKELLGVYPFGIRGEKKKIFKKENEGKLLITSSVYSKAKGMRDAVFAHPLAKIYMSQPAIAEQSIFWTWSEDIPMRCRIRPDWIRSDGVLVDLKTTKSVRAASFLKSIELFRYHVQAGFYSEGYKQAYGEYPREFVFVAVEKIPPYHVGIFKLDPESVRLGWAQAQLDLKKAMRLYETGQWGSDTPTEIKVSSWQYRMYDQKRQEEDKRVYARKASRNPIIGGQDVCQSMGNFDYGPNVGTGHKSIIK